MLRTEHAGPMAMGIKRSMLTATSPAGKGSWRAARSPPKPRLLKCRTSPGVGPGCSRYRLYIHVNAIERCL